MFAGSDHILLVHVIGNKAMKQREPGPGASKKPLAARAIRARMINEFGPAIAIGRNCAHGLEVDWRVVPVQPFDQTVPCGIELQIFRLVDDPCAVDEADDAHRTTAIVRVRKLARDAGDRTVGIGPQDVTTNLRKISIETGNEFARRIDPLTRQHGNQAQQDRLLFKQTSKSTGLHVIGEAVVK